MKTYHLTETRGADMETRFHVNGLRVSRAEYTRICDEAYAHGRLECLHTSGRQMTGGRIRRVNRSVASF